MDSKNFILFSLKYKIKESLVFKKLHSYIYRIDVGHSYFTAMHHIYLVKSTRNRYTEVYSVLIRDIETSKLREIHRWSTFDEELNSLINLDSHRNTEK